MFSAVVAVAFSIGGVVADAKMIKGFKHFSCNYVGVLHEILHGAVAENGGVWMGLTGV